MEARRLVHVLQEGHHRRRTPSPRRFSSSARSCSLRCRIALVLGVHRSDQAQQDGQARHRPASTRSSILSGHESDSDFLMKRFSGSTDVAPLATMESKTASFSSWSVMVGST